MKMSTPEYSLVGKDAITTGTMEQRKCMTLMWMPTYIVNLYMICLYVC